MCDFFYQKNLTIRFSDWQRDQAFAVAASAKTPTRLRSIKRAMNRADQV